MDVLAAILACSLHYDDALVSAIVDNAHNNPYSIAIPDLDPSTSGAASVTLDAAVAQLAEATLHGARPLLGLMQLPIEWASNFGRDPQDLFDTCINISIGTAMLSEFDYACQKATRSNKSSTANASRRHCVLRRYAAAIRMPELTTVVSLELRCQHGRASLPADSPILPTVPTHSPWGSNCLFITEGSDGHNPGDEF